MRTLAIGIGLVLLSACGAATAPIVRVERGLAFAAAEPPPPPAPEVAIEGLMGGIDPRSVEIALEPRMGALAACVEDRRTDAAPIGGRMTIAFRIARDGSVLRAVPAASTIGDRDAERCALEVVRSTRFRAPSGGEADAAWTFEVDPGAHEAWDAHRARTAASRLARGCDGCDVTVTAWIDPRGRAVRAGASARGSASVERIDAVLESVRRARFPRARSIARVTFTIAR